MSRHRFAGVTGLLLAFLSVSFASGATLAAELGRETLPARAQRPDIVLLLLDDIPQMDDRLWERLPTIRRLFLEQGVRFTEYVGNDPLCCPGRANLLTGQWSHHHGVVRNDARLFDPNVSIATELQGAGYWTGIFGKYFNGMRRLRDKTPVGWTRSFLVAGNYWNYDAWTDGALRRYGTERRDYSTIQITRHAVAALRTAPARKPRFVWLSPYAIHAGRDQLGSFNGWQPAPLRSDLAAPACQTVPAWTTAAVSEGDLSDKPRWLQTKPARGPRTLRYSCAALLAVDRMLADVLAEFEAQGRPEPMVILTADNGMAWGAHHWRTKSVPYATPIPLFIHWPAVLGHEQTTITAGISNVDIAPTLCALAGCVMGPFPNGHRVDGINMLPVILNGGGASGREVIFEEHPDEEGNQDMPGWRGVRTTDEAGIGRWVYTEYATGEKELYDLFGGPCWLWDKGMPGDPCQLTNLANVPAHATVQARLAATLAARETNPIKVLRRHR